jgi:hypothetical protein
MLQLPFQFKSEIDLALAFNSHVPATMDTLARGKINKNAKISTNRRMQCQQRNTCFLERALRPQSPMPHTPAPATKFAL